MKIAEIHLHICASGEVPEALFGQKTPEMNDSDPYLFKTSKFFKNGSVFLKLQLGKDGNKMEKSGKFGICRAPATAISLVCVKM